MSEHTTGLLRLRNSSREAPDDFTLMAENGMGVCDCAPSNPDMSDAEGEANARRLKECWNVLARYNPEAVREVVSALRYIGHFAKDEGHMKTARTLHYDMAHVANEALAKLDREG